MSKERAAAFITFVETNAEIRTRLSKLQGAGSLVRLVEVAAESGYHFTVDDYRAAIVDFAAGELSDDALNGTLDELGLSPIGGEDA